MRKSLRVLNVEDSVKDVGLLTRHLTAGGYELKADQVDSAPAMEAALAAGEWDIILCDYSMPQFDARAALSVLQASGLDIPFIIISGTVGEEIAVEAMLTGASDYLPKNNLTRLIPAIERELATAENRRAQRQVALAEKRNEQLTKELDDIKFALDATTIVAITDQDGAINYVNDKFCQISGYAREELLGKDHRIINSDHHPNEFLRDLWTTIASGKIWQGEIKNRAKNGSMYWVDTTLVPFLDEDGSPYQYIATSYEITERKRIEEELEQTRDAALESVRLKSEFLANMSHEIRSPMNGVIGMTELLQASDLSLRQQEYTKAIELSADALLKIIDDILDFSKIEAGQLRFEKIDFDLRETVGLPVGMLVDRALAKRIKLEFAVSTETPSIVRGDPGRLRQVLTNLIGNAVKFTDEGEVIVSVTKDSETERHTVIRFEVKDTGIGIVSSVQPKLFYAFVQADGSTTRKFGGTGLGLAISKELVELMGGSIGVESKPGEGSTFWFTARFEKPLERLERDRPARSPSLSGLRVLIGDENEKKREILMHQITSWGMFATEADSGARVLGFLKGAAETDPFDVAILDLSDGFETVHAINADPKIAGVKVILMPSYERTDRDQPDHKTGIAAYLQKPIRHSQLYNCIANLFSGHDAKQNALPDFKQHETNTDLPKLKRGSIDAHIRILVAEDNAINMEVARNQLANLGYMVDSVLNGLEAVESVKNQEYSIVLMDCQMPEMDGFEATAEIRRSEGADHHTVIIAVTAHALEGDRQKCLDAGMDDYLSKPVKIDALRRMLERWTDPDGGTTVVVAEKPAKADEQVVDMSIINGYRELQQTGKTDLVTKLINLFVKSTEDSLSESGKATMIDDMCTIKREAHALKGSCGTIGAARMAALSLDLERSENSSVANSIISELNKEFGRVIEIIGPMRKDRKLK